MWRKPFGQPTDRRAYEAAHESPPVMIWPLYVLAVGAVFAGMVFYSAFVGSDREAFWGASIFVLNDIIELAHHVPFWVKAAPMVVTLVGLGLAWLLYIKVPTLPALLAARLRPLYLFSYNKWYFDELYDVLFVRPAIFIGRGLWKTGDGAVIDGLGPDGIANVTRNLAQRAVRLQSGYLYHYAFAMMIGVVLLVTWYMFWTVG